VVKLVGVAGYVGVVGTVVPERVAKPLAAGVLVLDGLGTCVDGLGGYWALESLDAVLLANGFDFQNAKLLLPLD
jgi:hypothetical protein